MVKSKLGKSKTAEPNAHRLKVFQAQFGFYDTVVAVPSQAAALRAWDTRQNLFASGDACLTTDAGAVASALSQPGKPLRRPIGGSEKFALEVTGEPQIPDVAKARGPRADGSTTRHRIARIVDRADLDASEKGVAELEQRREREEADFLREEEALEERRNIARREYLAARKTADARLHRAKIAFEKAEQNNEGLSKLQ